MNKRHVRGVMYLSILVGAAGVASAAYATTDSGDGAPSPVVALAPEAPARDAVQLQVPPDVKMQKLAFAVSGGLPLLRTVVTSANNPAGPLYGAGAEYWSGNSGLAVTNYTALSMSSSRDVLTEAQISALLLPNSNWGPVLAVTQNIGTGGWTQGSYQPTAARSRLFKAVDPDNSSRFIGLLIEQDVNNDLERITWYKEVVTGTIFAHTPSSLLFSVVLDSGGQPSTNPSDIDAQATWYFASGP
ncbi:hypothetical protein WMF37_12845 [Sorangium sp. So ce291]|uniref:hypothetical protein n=1 Tax=Sorangium sp. So ce291 TaxID=3133294 RepID=UPI003F6386F1